MPLETGDTIADLNASWPTGGDLKSQGDDHLRLIKTVLKNDVYGKADTYAKTEADDNFVDVTGDTMTGALTIQLSGGVIDALEINGRDDDIGQIKFYENDGVTLTGALRAYADGMQFRNNADENNFVFRNDGVMLNANDVPTRDTGDERWPQSVNFQAANMDDLTLSGVNQIRYWGSSSNPPGGSVPTLAAGAVLHCAVSDTRQSQLYVRGQTTPELWSRTYDGGVWTAWVQYTSTTLLALTRAGGDADDNIIDKLLDKIESLEARLLAAGIP